MANTPSPLMRMCYPHLDKPQDPREGETGDPKYSIMGLIPKSMTKTPAFQAMQKAAAEAAKAEFGADVFTKSGGKWPAWLRSPFRDGDTEVDDQGRLKCAERPELKGCLFINFRTQDKPKAKDRMGNIIPPECYRDELYAGCIVRVTYGAFAYRHLGNKGVSFALNNVQKWADHEPLGNVVPIEQDFMDDGPEEAEDQLGAFGIEAKAVEGPEMWTNADDPDPGMIF